MTDDKRYTLAEAAELFAARLEEEADDFDMDLLRGITPLSVREGRDAKWRSPEEWRTNGHGRATGWRQAASLIRSIAASSEHVEEK